MRTARMLSADYALTDEFSAAVANSSNLKWQASVNDAQTLLEILLREPPEILLIDLSLPMVDGVDVIEMISKIPMRETPMVFALADFCSTKALSLIKDHIIHSFFKPLDVKKVVNEISEFAKLYEPSSRHQRISYAVVDRMATDCLLELGISPHLQGYYALREAIKIIVCSKSRIKLSVIKHIYQSIADEFGSNVSAIEHAMRHAIDSAWMRADVNVLQDYFGYTFNEIRATPSNSQFMFMIADRIRTALGE